MEFGGGNFFRVFSTTERSATARARLAYAFDRMLVFGTAGLAYAQHDFRKHQAPGAVMVDQRSAAIEGFQVGWTAGAVSNT